MTRPPVDTGLYARSFVDVYDQWYADLHDLDQIVASCDTRFGAGARVLELGSGTGRIAAPLAAAGHRVVALDAALVMLHQDRSAARRVAADALHGGSHRGLPPIVVAELGPAAGAAGAAMMAQDYAAGRLVLDGVV